MPYKRMPDAGMDRTHGIRSVAFSNAPMEEYNASVADVSPIAYNLQNAEKGQALYERFCDHCHGAEGKGDGQVSITSGGTIAPPSNAFSKPEGQMFYSITYGKGVMGSHASQLSQQERWEVIQYLKVLNNGGTFPEENVSSVKTDSTESADAASNTGTENI